MTIWRIFRTVQYADGIPIFGAQRRGSRDENIFTAFEIKPVISGHSL
jgi:hypothetical protein